MKVKDFTNYEIDGIDMNDYPDFCDAFITSATAVLEDNSTREATEDEISELNEDSTLVYELVQERIF